MRYKRVGLVIIALGILIYLAMSGYRLLKSRSELKVMPEQEVALGYGIDPHLFLTVKSIRLQDGEAPRLSMMVRARNTGVEARINLAELRFAVRERNKGYSGSEISSWIDENGDLLKDGMLLPGRQATGDVRLSPPSQTDSSAIIIWKEADWYKWAPFLRETILNHRLRVEAREAIKIGRPSPQ
jgi:hypothetical protein